MEISDISLKSSYGWLVNISVNDYFQRQIAQKIFPSKIEADPFNTSLYMAFKYCFSFEADLAANFGCI